METELQRPPLEMWAGIECTVNRVGDRYGDQMLWNGHIERPEDLERFAALGIRALRYPVLWERTAPDSLENIRWTWAESRLNRLRELNIRPIVGLVHHGSGPRHTSLIEESFAEGLACYAGKVAERFPWITDWTPVNEPMTTARFSGLYGHWYPHGCDEQTFARALVNQCRGVALAMRAVRRINPAARLIQTDDLGRVYSTPRMRYQADFENERRWLSWDLLCGRVDRSHRMWWHLRWAGIEERELNWFLANPCPPDIIGVNHYLTSDRYLDEHIALYPSESIGHNGKEPYADVEAVRVLNDDIPGVSGVLQEAWARYRRPLAVTEVHLGCTREEQMRWLHEVWRQAQEIRHGGVNVRAVTPWALLGSFDWNSLLTRFEGNYEPGVFDVRGPAPRPTALAGLIKSLAAGQEPTHPVLASPGWWRTPKRKLYPEAETVCAPTPAMPTRLEIFQEPARPILIAGADSATGAAFARLCDHRGLVCQGLSSQEEEIEAALEQWNPWAVVYAAGYENRDGAEQEPAPCWQRNALIPARLAECCNQRGISFLLLSSDMVFDGQKPAPYLESDAVSPLNAYGRSKAEGERRVLEAHPSALIVRSGPLFGPWDEENFITRHLRERAAGRRPVAANAIIFSPTYLPDLVHACLDLLIDGETGLWHLANQAAVTWQELAALAAERAGFDAAHNEGRPRNAPSPQPANYALKSERANLLPPLENAIACYLRDCGVTWNELPPLIEHERRSEPLPTRRLSRKQQNALTMRRDLERLSKPTAS